jgi:hypothetical protein
MQPTRVGGWLSEIAKGQFRSIAVFDDLGHPIAATRVDGEDLRKLMSDSACPENGRLTVCVVKPMELMRELRTCAVFRIQSGVRWHPLTISSRQCVVNRFGRCEEPGVSR